MDRFLLNRELPQHLLQERAIAELVAIEIQLEFEPQNAIHSHLILANSRRRTSPSSRLNGEPIAVLPGSFYQWPSPLRQTSL